MTPVSHLNQELVPGTSDLCHLNQERVPGPRDPCILSEPGANPWTNQPLSSDRTKRGNLEHMISTTWTGNKSQNHTTSVKTSPAPKPVRILQQWPWPWKQQSNFLHKTLQIMMMYHPIKFGCKKINSSADMVATVISDYMSPHCDLELEDSKPIFLHDILAYGVASPHPVCLQRARQQRRYHPDEHSLEFWTSSVTWSLTTTEQSNLSLRQSTLWWCAIKPSLRAKGSAVQIT